MPTRLITPALAGAFVCFAFAVPARADSLTCTPTITSGFFACIAQPTKFYTSFTTPINVSGTTDMTSYSSLPVPSGPGLKVTFSTAMMRLTVPSSWGTWNCPPATEAACGTALAPTNLPVFWSNGATSVTMTLAPGERTFGFEAQPELSDVESITAAFFGSSGMLGSITRSVSGNAGALLFAASSNDAFTRVVVSDKGPKSGCPAGDVCDFAIANLRFSNLAIPEPRTGLSTVVGVGLVAILFGWHRLRRP